MRSVMGVLGLAASGLPYSTERPRELNAAPWARAVVAMGLTLLASAPLMSADLTSAQIIDKVSETYQGMKTFSFIVEQSPGVVGDYPQMPGFETRVSESRPGRVRLSNDAYTMVSDGVVTWVYLRRPNEYTEVNAAPLLGETWRVSPLGFIGWQYLRSYAGMPAGGAKLQNQKVLRVNSRRMRCYVVRVPVWCSSGSLRWVSGTEDLWVSKSRFTVWRIASPGPWSAGNCVGYPTLTVKRMDIGPIPEADFRFDPPQGARRVRQFADNEGGYLSTAGLYDAPNAGGGWIIGRTAPQFNLQDLNAKDFRLKKLGGMTVVLDFWASWCRPCQEELAAVQKMHGEFASKGAVFLGIDDESPETIRAFVKDKGYTFPMLVDTNQAAHQLYGVRWAPTTVVIDRKGKIAAHYVGAGGEAQLRQALKSAGLDTTKP